MTRLKRAIETSKKEFILQNPEMNNKDTRVKWWLDAHPLEKQMFMDFMTAIAIRDLGIVEPLTVIK